ncbi:GNAT family N-acetyltransferase [Pseudonocardia sp. CA-107938]|uniref:GNAT family N-acetyltransferase n=1 Tax=Pseudonocardia sp. CA-107938 TaxID=3240021 RepID=UPI003D917D6F
MIEYAVRGPVDDAELSRLHAAAFDVPVVLQPWAARLAAHSLTWVTATDDRLVGFVNVAWDGGAHAFLLDTVVDPDRQGAGIGRALVAAATRAAAAAGCAWLHVDHVEELTPFYAACGFRPTAAGLIRLV